MSERGVFALDRGWFDHPVFADEPYTEREAWAWLIANAAWKPYQRKMAGKIHQLERGQLVASLTFLASKWQFTREKVRWYLNTLKSHHMIQLSTNTGITIITICNYDVYQRVSLPNNTVYNTDDNTATTQQQHKVEDIKDIKSITIRKEDSTSEAVSMFNETAARVGWPKVLRLTAQRRTRLLGRLNADGIQGWREVLDRASSSAFLCGENSRGWKLDFDFIVRDDKFNKIKEGGYGNGSIPTQSAGAKANPVLAARDNLLDRLNLRDEG